MTEALAVRVEGGLLRVEEAGRLLAECKTIDEARDIHDKAQAITVYLRQQNASREAQNDAAEIKVRAERRLGELLEPSREKRGGAKSTRTTLPDGITRDQSARWQDVARIPEEKFEGFIQQQREKPDGEVTTAGVLRATAVSSAPEYDGDEWYTPPEIIEATRVALGDIDLDPASNAHAQRTIRAAKFYSKQDDGLSQEWNGRVFCNPPYSYPLIERFTNKLLDEWKADRVKTAVYLVNNCTDAAWFHLLLRLAPVCFTAGRISFMDTRGVKFATRQGQAIFYLGDDAVKFREAFDALGTVVAARPSA